MTLEYDGVLALLAPEYRAYTERARLEGGPTLSELSIAEARRLMRDMQQTDLSGYPVRAERHMLDGFSVLVVKPASADELLPAVVYFHGGGWVLGDAETHARMVREIAVQARAAVVFVEYDCAPEAPFPLALEQCYRACAWVSQQGRSAGLDPVRIAVAGDSAGGNLAAAVALLAVRRGGPDIRLQALLYPVTDCNFSTPSYRDFGTGLNLDVAAMRWFWDHYISDPATRRDPLASPLRAQLADLSGLPPALVITAECDVLRDEGEAYARKLADAGIAVNAVRYMGTLHGFMMIDELAHEPQARSAIRLLTLELREALKDKK
jgi:acetyl esterase